jgi:signal transduction histidine kinase
MDTLRGNLDKVVQHGRRADAIVKNMLQHSREGSGEHRPVDINTLVEESLNLAWHGARAEKQGFEIALRQSFDPSAGEADVFPQDITRALLNVISNGFYAAIKRGVATTAGDYEPTLAASTKNLGDRVEIRIRDNGTGIPPDVKEKMFNPFFTTKPTGEGEIRLVEMPSFNASEGLSLWVELYDRDLQLDVDSCKCSDLDEAIDATQRLIDLAKRLNNAAWEAGCAGTEPLPSDL